MTPKRFRTLVLAHAKEQGRHDLPWRSTFDPYHILVSEVMLQQTQVERVVPFYQSFLISFPNIKVLAEASLGDVLVHWQGLGYNRRAKMLHDAAKLVMKEHAGQMPRSVEQLEQLPGVGHYTARAIAAFAYNEDVVFVETNLRTAVIHHFFSTEKQVSDKEIHLVLEQTLPKGSARQWYSALMDYGAFLKRSGVRVNTKSSAYTKQSVFKGSDREVRGAVLRALLGAPRTKSFLGSIFGRARRNQVDQQLEKLLSEGLIQKHHRRYRLPG